LRLADNPALCAAVERGGEIIPLFVDCSAEEGGWAAGGALRWWLHQSLQSLSGQLAALGAPLRYARGRAADVIAGICAATGADAVFWNRSYEPLAVARDQILQQTLRARGLIAESRNGSLLIEPWELATQSGTPFRVFTPFWRQALRQLAPAAPLAPPRALRAVNAAVPGTCSLAELQLLPTVRWHEQMQAMWSAGEYAAREQLQDFCTAILPDYRDSRERPAITGTSRLSPYLRVGAISPRQVWHAIAMREDPRISKFLTEIGWREFSHHLLYHFPHIVEAPLRPEFARFPWREDAAQLRAWQRGETGVPLVDAGMRELWATGWMHNRVRMVVASFLVKNLRLHWLHGARWFWDTLIDADLANNTQGWQWAAGCGADAAPYFRIFNPYAQAARFDPTGAYVQRWAPEPRSLIVDLAASRTAALAAYRSIRAPTS
jgi:deoxyribodipyrimidine photo-lyase